MIDLNHPGVWIGFVIFAFFAFDLIAQRFASASDSAARQSLATQRKRNADMHNRLITLEARTAIAHRTHRLWRERKFGIESEPLDDEKGLASLQCDIVKAMQDNDAPRE